MKRERSQQPIQFRSTTRRRPSQQGRLMNAARMTGRWDNERAKSKTGQREQTTKTAPTPRKHTHTHTTANHHKAEKQTSNQATKTIQQNTQPRTRKSARHVHARHASSPRSCVPPSTQMRTHQRDAQPQRRDQQIGHSPLATVEPS